MNHPVAGSKLKHLRRAVATSINRFSGHLRLLLIRLAMRAALRATFLAREFAILGFGL
jgi:hypothetical protein